MDLSNMDKNYYQFGYNNWNSVKMQYMLQGYCNNHYNLVDLPLVDWGQIGSNHHTK
jgi:hypothetical protein